MIIADLLLRIFLVQFEFSENILQFNLMCLKYLLLFTSFCNHVNIIYFLLQVWSNLNFELKNIEQNKNSLVNIRQSCLMEKITCSKMTNFIANEKSILTRRMPIINQLYFALNTVKPVYITTTLETKKDY